MSLASSATRGAVVTLFWQSSRVVLQLLTVVVLARIIAPRDIGLLAMVLAITGFAELVRDFGLSVAAVQAKTLSRDEKSNLFWINSLFGLLLTGIVCALSGAIAGFYGEPVLSTIVIWTSLTFFLNGVATQFRAELNRNLRFSALSLAEIVPQFLGFLAALLVAYTSPTFWALIAQQLTMAGTGLVLVVLLARWWPGLPKRSAPVWHLARFGAGLAGTQTIAYLTKNVDNISIGYVWGPAPLGIYARAYQVAMLPIQQVTAPLSRVAIPILSQVSDDEKRYLNYLLTGQSVSGFVCSVIYGVMCGLAHPLVLILFGANWMGMVPVIQALAIGGIFRALGQISYWIFVSRGLTGHQFRFYLVTQPIIMLMMLAGLPWGGAGVAIGVASGYALLWAIQLWWAGKVSGVRIGELMRNGILLFGSIAVPTAGLGLAAVALVANPFLAIAAGLAAIAIFYLLVFALFERPRQQFAQLRQLYFNRKAGKAKAVVPKTS